MEAGKFQGFMLNNRGLNLINLNKCQVVMDKSSPQSFKEGKQLVGWIATLSHFIASLAHKAASSYQLLRKKKMSEWNEECEQALKVSSKA